MPYLEQPWELFKLLKTKTIPVTEVRVGDVVLDSHHGRESGAVAHVTEIDKETPGFITLANKELTGVNAGYIRSITRHATDSIRIIDRSCRRFGAPLEDPLPVPLCDVCGGKGKVAQLDKSMRYRQKLDDGNFVCPGCGGSGEV